MFFKTVDGVRHQRGVDGRRGFRLANKRNTMFDLRIATRPVLRFGRASKIRRSNCPVVARGIRPRKQPEMFDLRIAPRHRSADQTG